MNKSVKLRNGSNIKWLPKFRQNSRFMDVLIFEIALFALKLSTSNGMHGYTTVLGIIDKLLSNVNLFTMNKYH